jgi:hypothetical protein
MGEEANPSTNRVVKIGNQSDEYWTILSLAAHLDDVATDTKMTKEVMRRKVAYAVKRLDSLSTKMKR